MVVRARELMGMVRLANPRAVVGVSKEWPTGILGWQLQEVQDLEEEYDMQKQQFEGCKLGLVARSGKHTGQPLRKAWTMSTNIEVLGEILAQYRCVGRHRCDNHVPIEGEHTNQSGKYPALMAYEMVGAYNQWVKEWEIEKKKGKIRLKPGRVAGETLDEHAQMGHRNYRRDCHACVSGGGRGKMHRRVANPEAGVLSLDVAGPFAKGDKGERYFVLAALTVETEDEEEKEKKEAGE
jgi:hypothetical protein